MKLIVNADDFGLDLDRDLGIAYGVICGYISSVSVIVTGNIGRLRKGLIHMIRKKASVGIHINLTDDPLIMYRAEELCEVQYAYKRWKHNFWRNSLEGTINVDKIGEEIDAQIKTFAALFGFFPEHIDGHNHCNIFSPMIAERFEQVACRHRIHLRIPDEALDRFHFDSMEIPAFFREYKHTQIKNKQTVCNHLAYYFKYDMLMYEVLCKENCKRNDIHFIGTMFGYFRTAEVLLAQLREYQEEDIVQLMVHPGFYFPFFKHYTPFSSAQRYNELRCLQAAYKYAQTHGLEYVTYTDKEIIEKVN